MKLAVSFDADGKILTLFDAEKLRSEKVTLRYVPSHDEQHQVIELPQEFEKETFFDLPRLLRVNAASGRPKFERK